MPYKPKEDIYREQNAIEFDGKKIKPPKIRKNKYGEDIVHIGAEIPLTLWEKLTEDSLQKRIPLMQNLRVILEIYYAKPERD